MILCEGKKDVWFFHEIMKDHVDDSSIMCIPNHNIKKLQKMLGKNCFTYIKNQYPLIIYGDNGRVTVIDKVLNRLIKDLSGKEKDDILITVIIDDDGTDFDTLNMILSDKIKTSISEKWDSPIVPTLSENNGYFIINHPKSKGGTLKIKLSTVPRSLEDKVSKKTVEFKCPHNSKILNNGAKKAIKYLSNEYFNSEEDLFREAAMWLKEERWVNNIPSIYSSN